MHLFLKICYGVQKGPVNSLLCFIAYPTAVNVKASVLSVDDGASEDTVTKIKN